MTADSVLISVALSEVTWSVVALSLSTEGPLFGREAAGATHSSSAALGGELVGAGDMIAPPMHFAKGVMLAHAIAIETTFRSPFRSVYISVFASLRSNGMLPKRLRLNLRWEAPARWRFVPIREVRVAKIIFCRRMFVLGLCCISSQS